MYRSIAHCAGVFSKKVMCGRQCFQMRSLRVSVKQPSPVGLELLHVILDGGHQQRAGCKALLQVTLLLPQQAHLRSMQNSVPGQHEFPTPRKNIFMDGSNSFDSRCQIQDQSVNIVHGSAMSPVHNRL